MSFVKLIVKFKGGSSARGHSAEESFMSFAHKINKDGTEGRTRTGTILLSSDFESDASTSFTTPAYHLKKKGQHIVTPF